EAVVTVGQTEQGGRRLVGYVVGGEGSVPDWRQTLSTQLPDYMVPSALVSLEALPLTANGKLDRRALPEPDAASLATGDYHAPRNETERTLASIWRAILQVERIGIHDNFFELGG
ncbi:AMP-binding enzyme, partial [Xanthomonas arboricola]|uniref:AMP-binding enzyme n=1 Tax=Xanthomonas arboricola TaxID=56448 RepID=UPI00128FF4FD